MNTQADFVRLRDAIAGQDEETAHSVLQALWESRIDFEIATRLLGLLEDSDDISDTMYGIIHVVERANPADVYAAIAAKLPEIAASAPKWASILVARHLAARFSQGRGFDAIAFLDAMNKQASAQSKDVFKAIVSALGNKGTIDLSQ